MSPIIYHIPIIPLNFLKTTGSGGDSNAAYGNLFTPTDTGAQGGSYSGNAGGQGGSYQHITVGSVFTMDGRLDADGADAANHAGGGAGGSILVEACE